MEKSRGGKREGAGRPSVCKGKTPLNLTISGQTKEVLNEYSECLGRSRSDLIDWFVSSELVKSKSIVKCPVCGKPLLWIQSLPKSDKVKCKICDTEFDVSSFVKKRNNAHK